MDTSPENILAQGTILGVLKTLFPRASYLPFVAFTVMLIPYCHEYLGDAIKTRLVSTVEIRSHDEVYNYVMGWVTRNSISRGSHRLLASSSIKNETMRDEGRNGTGDDNEVDNGDIDPVSNSPEDLRHKISLYNARPLLWTPAMGTHYFWYEGRILSFTRSVEDREQTIFSRQRPEKVIISCLGRDPTIIKRLIYKARIEYLEKQRGQTSIYRASKTYGDELIWMKCMTKATRPLSTIALGEDLKKGLIQDLERYLSPQTKRWYANRGIPYRRGYLFSGPPGTGKTSLTLAAAGSMGLNIYMISLNSPLLSEDTLATLFRDLPRTCLVLLEDIDATGLTQKRRTDQTADEGPGIQAKDRISLSGLLNVIDGVAAQEGRVLVMTSNHTENLDPALLRPGRVDFSVKFGLATTDTASQLFIQMYEASCDEATVGDGEKQAVKVSYDKTPLSSLAAEFGSKVPELMFSPAAIQGYLLTHQDDPVGAIAAVDDWVKQQALNKKQKLIEEAPKPVEDKSETNTSDKDG
ncbi:hypothetical protein FDECE_17480 [Fusarium decemcellulare]|nr:hypothetical protein FDECE_17480 [Fusarium decemcellulare]